MNVLLQLDKCMLMYKINLEKLFELKNTPYTYKYNEIIITEMIDRINKQIILGINNISTLLNNILETNFNDDVHDYNENIVISSIDHEMQHHNFKIIRSFWLNNVDIIYDQMKSNIQNTIIDIEKIINKYIENVEYAHFIIN